MQRWVNGHILFPDSDVHHEPTGRPDLRRRVCAFFAQLKRPEVLKPFCFLSPVISLLKVTPFPFFTNFLVIFLKVPTSSVWKKKWHCVYLYVYFFYTSQKTDCPIDPYVGSAIVYVTRSVSAVAAMVVLHKFRRRPIYFACATLIALATAWLVFYTYDMEHRAFLPEWIWESPS